MKSASFLFGFLLLLLACSNESSTNPTLFEGTVFFEETGEPVTNGIITIAGEVDRFINSTTNELRQETLDENGQFFAEFEANADIDNFSISVVVLDEEGFIEESFTIIDGLSCSGLTCNSIPPGESYLNLRISIPVSQSE